MRDMTAASDETEFVTLCLGAEVFAVPVAMVREILDYRDGFRIPEGPDYLLGLIDVRGRGTPVIDLRTKLGLPKVPPTPATRIMVLDVPLSDRVLSLGLVADRVLEVATFAASQIEGAPDVGVPWRSDYIAGVVRRDGGFVVLFNLPKLLTAADMVLLSSATEKAA
jgi:purine-binding chemotaxis protein CheW